MERLKDMGLKRAFFLLSVGCLAASLLLAGAVWTLCGRAMEAYPSGGIAIQPDGSMVQLAQPTAEQFRKLSLLGDARLLALVLLPAGGMAAAGVLFYRWKLKRPIAVLQAGTARIRAQDLDFTLPPVSGDELGQVCAAFEEMRRELLRTNQALWRQAEERRRLNAAFAHDLHNPVTVLKGTVKLLRQGTADPQALDRLERYTLRIEAYVSAMSGVQRLEQLPVRPKAVPLQQLREELEETASVLAPELEISGQYAKEGSVMLDHGFFLIAAENLIGNAARFARSSLTLTLTAENSVLRLTVTDDGPGFPDALLKTGPQPFGRVGEEAEHFGMGLYSSQLLCRKHGGDLVLENVPGACSAATFALSAKS